MRLSTLLVLTGLLISNAQAEDSVTATPSETETTTPSSTPATDPAAIQQQLQQRREAWRALSPEQRQARLQSVRSQAQTLRKQHGNPQHSNP